MCQKALVWSSFACLRGFWEVDDARVESDMVLSALARSMEESISRWPSQLRTDMLYTSSNCVINSSDCMIVTKLKQMQLLNRGHFHCSFVRGIARRLARTRHPPVTLKCRFKHISIKYSLFSHSPEGFDTSLNVSMDETHSSLQVRLLSWENSLTFFITVVYYVTDFVTTL